MKMQVGVGLSFILFLFGVLLIVAMPTVVNAIIAGMGLMGAGVVSVLVPISSRPIEPVRLRVTKKRKRKRRKKKKKKKGKKK